MTSMFYSEGIDWYSLVNRGHGRERSLAAASAWAARGASLRDAGLLEQAKAAVITAGQYQAAVLGHRP